MNTYNRAYYGDRVMTPTPGHQPIYTQVPLNWSANLTTQVAPRDLKTPGVASPLLVGVASRSGAILESYNLAFVGAAGAPGSFLHLYTRREPDSEISYMTRIDLNSGGAQHISGRFPFLILPAPEQAWRLEPSQEVYVALSVAIPAGLNVFFLGGHYS